MVLISSFLPYSLRTCEGWRLLAGGGGGGQTTPKETCYVVNVSYSPALNS